MIEHLSSELIDRYRQRRIEPSELLALDDHLTTCADCRQQLRAAFPVASAPGLLQTNVLANQPDSQPESEHLSINQLRFYLAEQLDAVDRELAESHLEFCAACQSRSHELRFAARPSSEPAAAVMEKTASETWFRRLMPDWPNLFSPGLALRFAGAAALLALVIWGVMRWRPSSDKQQEITQVTPTPTGDDRLPPTPGSTLTLPGSILALNDGGNRVAIDAAGNLTGAESFSAAEQQAVKNALLTAQVETPRTLAELKSAADKLMGAPGDDPAHAWAAAARATLQSPFGEVMAEDRPTIRWKPLAGAESYVVTVNDLAANYRKVAVSSELTATRWTPPRALPRGRLYTWQVTALLKDSDGNRREVTAPAPEAAEAIFRVLSPAQAEELAQGKQLYQGRPLPLGLLYARLGLLKDAERELQSLADSNPNEPVAQKLLRNLRGKQRNARALK